ncbi:hypothetical protein [Natronomonas amylolytica]|uniref:hypothetical protein n=1 Tax=Natronomonas amylolytica TaxID=3108498 RepID=UPI00300942F3
MPTRRHLLATAGIAVAGAGCMGALGDEGDSSPEDDGNPTTESAATIELGELAVENNHEEAHQIQLAIEDGEEVLELGTYDLEAGGSTTVEGEWLEEAGDYRIHARLDDGEVRTADISEKGGEEVDCVRVLVRVGRGGRLDIWDGAGCEDA